jgi:hypothetical protein
MKKTQYRVRNWATYNTALGNRGNLTLWVDEEALQAWQYTGPGNVGRNIGLLNHLWIGPIPPAFDRIKPERA